MLFWNKEASDDSPIFSLKVAVAASTVSTRTSNAKVKMNLYNARIAKSVQRADIMVVQALELYYSVSDQERILSRLWNGRSTPFSTVSTAAVESAASR